MKKTILSILALSVLSGAGAQLRYRPQGEVPKAKAEHIIFIYLDGGASNVDTFDPKPEAGRGVTGKYDKPIKTKTPGMLIGQRLKHLAAISDKYTIIRSMRNDINAHETGHYATTTGDMSSGSIVYPSFCSMLSYLLEPQCHSKLFPYITLTEASTRFNEAGFLPSQFKSFDTGGNPSDPVFTVDGIATANTSQNAIQRRAELIGRISGMQTLVERTQEVEQMQKTQQSVFEMLDSDSKRVFDLSDEPQDLREQYGMTKFGQSCLCARRLVEEGVTCVCVRFIGWDTHKEHFARMDERLDDLDNGVSALILDLERRGLLEKTLIVCGGEFGRTPKVDFAPPWNGGRGHWGHAFSYLVAGAGIKSGLCIGQTDSKGERVVGRSIYPADLIAAIYTIMGIDPKGEILHPTAGYIPLLPSLGKPKQSEGIATEILE